MLRVSERSCVSAAPLTRWAWRSTVPCVLSTQDTKLRICDPSLCRSVALSGLFGLSTALQSEHNSPKLSSNKTNGGSSLQRLVGMPNTGQSEKYQLLSAQEVLVKIQQSPQRDREEFTINGEANSFCVLISHPFRDVCSGSYISNR